MVILNLNIIGIAVLPNETDTPLIIDAEAILAFAVTA
jgi:hypothetical protein